MRPSDENQDKRMHAHLRPNLMSSSRRGGHEDSILAKLEREPVHGSGAGYGLRLAWYGAATVLALGLTATLAWLAAGTGPAALEVAQADAPPPAAPVAPAAPPAPAATALIVDARPEPPAAAPIPPLRLLKPAAVRPEPVKAAPPRRLDARPAAPARARPEARRQASRPPPRRARTVNPARAADAADDSDVALISAVIFHANGHAAPTEEPVPPVVKNPHPH